MYLRRCDVCGYTEELDEFYFDHDADLGTSRWGKPKEKNVNSHWITTGIDKKGKSKIEKIDLCSKCYSKISGSEIAAYNKLIEENK